MQEKVLKALGELSKAEKINESRKLEYINVSNIAVDTRVSSLMIFDQELNDYWFTSLKLFGEAKAFELTRNEAIRLSSDPDYAPCPNNN